MISDMSHAETRLIGFIDIFEFHIYNRSRTYDRLEKLFGLKISLDDDDGDDDDDFIKPDQEKDKAEGKKTKYQLLY